MAWLLKDFDLLSVVLRALSLSFEALTLGGLLFLLWIAAPAGCPPERRAESFELCAPRRLALP